MKKFLRQTFPKIGYSFLQRQPLLVMITLGLFAVDKLEEFHQLILKEERVAYTEVSHPLVWSDRLMVLLHVHVCFV